MGAIDLIESSMAEGVEFATNGDRIRWRNSDGRMTPETVAELEAAKPEVIDFLTRKRRPDPHAPRPDGLPADAGAYLDFLRSKGPMTYGAAATTLGWGGTRLWQAEARLRATGLVRHDGLGKAHPVAK